MTLCDELKTFSQVGFRDIYKKFIYIHCRELLDEMMPGELSEDITGVIAYCYIDRTEGISFRPIMIAAMKLETLQVFDYPDHENTIYTMYKGLLGNYQQTLSSFVGPTKVFVSGDTLQVSDYNKLDWEWSMFDPESKHKRHDTVFPQECRKIFEMGKELVNG